MNSCIIDYFNLVEYLTKKRVKELRCDNGIKYINQKVRDFIRDKGIVFNPCPPSA